MGAEEKEERLSPDHAMLRDLIGKVMTVDSKLDQAMILIGERRRHADSLDDRIREVEHRLHAIEILGAEGKSIPGMLKDHEGRIRGLEAIRFQLLAYAFAGSVIGAGVIWLLGLWRG